MQKAKKKITRRDAIKLAKQYIDLCTQMNLPIYKAILFGSHANDNAQNESDIDLLLVSEMFVNNTLENWKLLAPITARLFEVEPHPYPYSNFIKGDPFINEIKKTGVEITF